MLKRSCACGGIHNRGEPCPKVAARKRARDIAKPVTPAYRSPEYRRNAALVRATYVEGQSRCVRCGKLIPRGQVTVEHKIPLRRGGTNDLSNLALACRCNYAWQRDPWEKK